MDQLTFSPIDYGFEFTDDWYKFDRTEAHKAALKARNMEARRLRKAGHTVRAWTLKNQLVSMGGIGSGYPHVEQIVNVYGLNYQ